MGPRIYRCALAMAALLGTPGITSAGGAEQFSAEQRARIIALGPWPPKFDRDPSNRVSGQPLAIEFGRLLFFDPRMSPSGYIACVTCHAPDRAFADLKARAHGLADLERNTIALANLRLRRLYGWAGSSDSLWMASLRPILDPREFDGSPASVARLFQRDDELARCYVRVFGVLPTGDDERTLVNVGKALAAFLESLRTGRTSFDEFRDALAQGEAAKTSYPGQARRGLALFVGRAGCVDCHGGPNFTDDEFHDTGVPPPIAPVRLDRGRAEGVRLLIASRFNQLGPYNDNLANGFAQPHVRIVDEHELNGQFRTPSLRNVAVTAPYMHNGRLETLEASLRQHAVEQSHGRPDGAGPPLEDGEIADLVAFLKTLTDRHGERRPFPAATAECSS
jgi:cytochrome c peroxidase